MDAAEDGDVIYVIKDHTLDSSNLPRTDDNGGQCMLHVTAASEKTITIDFNGKTVRANTSTATPYLYGIILVDSNANLILQDSVGGGGLICTAADCENECKTEWCFVQFDHEL